MIKDSGVEAYVSPRQRELTPREEVVRDISYLLKNALPEAVKIAAAAMAQKVTEHSVLVPIYIVSSSRHLSASDRHKSSVATD